VRPRALRDGAVVAHQYDAGLELVSDVAEVAALAEHFGNHGLAVSSCMSRVSLRFRVLCPQGRNGAIDVRAGRG
jgi:hypothetical protein